MSKNVIAIIPARGGSKGLPRKNILPLAGKPLLAYSIEPARQARLVDRVMVCTEDPEIAEIAKNLGAEVPFRRDPALAGDKVGCNEVMIWMVNELFTCGALQSRDDIIVYLQPTDLFKKAEWLDECVQTLLDNTGVDSVFIGAIEKKNYWEKRPDGGFQPMGGGPHPGHDNRQVKPQIFREDTGLGAAMRAYVWSEMHNRLGNNSIILPKDYHFFDIHSAEDLFLAEQYLKFRQKNE